MAYRSRFFDEDKIARPSWHRLNEVIASAAEQSLQAQDQPLRFPVDRSADDGETIWMGLLGADVRFMSV